jgi:hypothetical protein
MSRSCGVIELALSCGLANLESEDYLQTALALQSNHTIPSIPEKATAPARLIRRCVENAVGRLSPLKRVFKTMAEDRNVSTKSLDNYGY